MAGSSIDIPFDRQSGEVNGIFHFHPRPFFQKGAGMKSHSLAFTLGPQTHSCVSTDSPASHYSTLLVLDWISTAEYNIEL
jgi:hypothetical protein